MTKNTIWGHSRAHTHALCVCVQAWARMKAIILRARVIFAIEGRAERVAEREGRWGGRRNIIKGERRRGTSRAGNAPDVEDKEREEVSSLSFLSTPSLSRVSLLFRDSIADPRNYFCRLPSFDRKARRHRRSRLSTGEDNWTPADLMKIIIFSM